MWRAAPLVAMLLIAGCGHNIGDSCQTNVDCSPQGDRFCDRAPPGGYCTQENCDINSCPGNSVCIRFFTPLNEPCRPSDSPTICKSDERCVCDQTTSAGCVDDKGHCAPSSSEHRWCQARCSSDGDCRSGYQCRQTGTFGAEAVPTFDLGTPSAKFCAPTGNPS